jgi:hypothetical protein
MGTKRGLNIDGAGAGVYFIAPSKDTLRTTHSLPSI